MLHWLQATNFYSNAVRIEQDLTVANSWCEIDAIQITGSYIGSSSPTTDGAINHFSTSPTTTDGGINHSSTSPTTTDGGINHSSTLPTTTDGGMEPSSSPATSTVGDVHHSSSSPPPTRDEINQWVSYVIGFSSQYSVNRWAISQ